MLKELPHILAAGDESVPKVIFGVIFVILWAVSSLMSQVAKKREKERRERLRIELERGVQMPPAPIPPAPVPAKQRIQKPVRMQQPKPAAPSRTGAAARPFSKMPVAMPAITEQASPVVTQRIAPKGSANASSIRAWMRPMTLRQQFILTEIFQPPVGLRE